MSFSTLRRHRPQFRAVLLWLAWTTVFEFAALAAPREITFSQPPGTVEAYDFLETTIRVAGADAKNPFTDVIIRGMFGKADGNKVSEVDGFCDSADGSVFRIRFMPPAAGDYSCSIKYQQGEFEKTVEGKFTVVDGHRRGPIRMDPKYRWHFIWEGTGDHYFFNGTTAFWLMGWRDERIIESSLERLHQLKVNRLRVLLAGHRRRLGQWAGRRYDAMIMLKGYEHMVDFFTSFEWWKTEPHDELVNNGAYCLAKPGECYAVYLPKGGKVTVQLGPGTYEAKWFGAFTGEIVPLPPAKGLAWTSPPVPGPLDWALLLRKRD